MNSGLMNSFILAVLLLAAATSAHTICEHDLPPQNDLDLFMCPFDAGIDTIEYSNRLTQRTCACRAGIIITDSAGDSCFGETRDCGTLECSRQRTNAEVEIYGPYAGEAGDNCVAMRAAFRDAAANATDQCYSRSCSFNETKSCIDSERMIDCANVSRAYDFWQYATSATAYEALAAFPTKIPRFLAPADLTKRNLIKSELAHMLNLNENEIVLLVPEDGWAVISVTSPIATDPARPSADGTRMSILTRLQSNQSWIDANLRKPRAAWCPPQAAEPDATTCMQQSASQYAAFLAQDALCDMAYCQCLGYEPGVQNCSIPVGFTQATVCTEESVKCQFKKAISQLNNRAGCQDLYNFFVSPANVFNDCIDNACSLDDSQIRDEAKIRALCTSTQTYSTTLSTSNDVCANTSLPEVNRVDPLSCVMAYSNGIDELASRNNECEKRACLCRNGLAKTNGADFQCDSPTRDCGTMNCTEVRYTCLLDLFSRYATVDSPECTAMSAQFSSLSEYDCYATACSHNRTATCLDTRYQKDCDMFPNMGSRYAAALAGADTVATFPTSVDMMAQSITDFYTMKNAAAAILGISETDFVVLPVRRGFISFVVTEPSAAFFSSPAGLTTTLLSNKPFSDMYLAAIPSPSPTSSPIPVTSEPNTAAPFTTEPNTPIPFTTEPNTPFPVTAAPNTPTPAITAPPPGPETDSPAPFTAAPTTPAPTLPVVTVRPTMDPALWCNRYPVAPAADVSCLGTSTLQTQYTNALVMCDNQLTTCKTITDPAALTTCLTSAYKCANDVAQTLLSQPTCNSTYAMITDDDVLFFRCASFMCANKKDLGREKSEQVCRAVADASEQWCRKQTNTVCRLHVDSYVLDVEPFVNSMDIFQALEQCVASSGRPRDTSSCYADACQCENGIFDDRTRKCDNKMSHCGTLNCTRDLMVCIVEKVAPYLAQVDTLECREALKSMDRFGERYCGWVMCRDEDDSYCSNDEIGNTCRTMANIYNPAKRVKQSAPSLAVFSLTADAHDAMKADLASLLGVRPNDMVMYFEDDFAVSINVIDPDYNRPIIELIAGNQTFEDKWLSLSGAIPTWCEAQDAALPDEDTCTVKNELAYQSGAQACGAAFCGCMQTTNSSDGVTCSIPMDQCWTAYPICLRRRHQCLDTLRTDAMTGKAECNLTLANAANVTNELLECMEDVCTNEIWSSDCTANNHKAACAFSVGPTDVLPPFVRPPVLPIPTTGGGPTPIPDSAAMVSLESKIRACLRMDNSTTVAFLSSVNNCTIGYIRCTDTATVKNLECPQKNVLTLSDAQTCIENKYQCHFELTAGLFEAIDTCPTALLTQYLQQQLQYDDCVTSYKNDNEFAKRGQSDADRVASCSKVRDMAAMRTGSTAQVQLLMGGPIDQWTNAKRDALRETLSAMFNVKAQSVKLFVSPTNATASVIRVAISANAEKRDASSPVLIVDAASMAQAMGGNATFMSQYQIASAPTITAPTAGAPDATPTSQTSSKTGMIVGIVLGGGLLLTIAVLMVRRNSQEYIITDQEMRMQTDFEYRSDV